MRGIFSAFVDLFGRVAHDLASGGRARMAVPLLLVLGLAGGYWLYDVQKGRQAQTADAARDSAPSAAAMPTAPAEDIDKAALPPVTITVTPARQAAPTPPPAFRDTRPLTSKDAVAAPVTVNAALPGKSASSGPASAQAAPPQVAPQAPPAGPGFRDQRPLAADKALATKALSTAAGATVAGATKAGAQAQQPDVLAARPAPSFALPSPLTAAPTAAARALPAVVSATSSAAGVASAIPAAPVRPSAPEPARPRKTILGSSDCNNPGVAVEPLEGGRSRIVIVSPCRAAEMVKISYGGVDYVRRLDAGGYAEANLDLFAGARRSADVEFGDGQRRVIPLVAHDLDRVSKVAVRWRAPVNLDLHVFEYAAAVGQPGHVWANARSSLAAARESARTSDLGHGFLSSAADGITEGDRIEVYTFFHNERQASGTVALAIDYETRGQTPPAATCGQGEHAKVEFQFFTLSRQGDVAQASGALRPVACGLTIEAAQRFNQAMLPMLRIRR